ncbi:dityrosine synthesis enzyme [Coccomyxa viridis]|uniref:Dityrosine synthesis enzyme n=1 Tax=Coccomyxa viridis TaxID=1274662 RepID=A0AAV1HW21_9CHLO|nr:dityrosine synthesis enzyme [Coccomyxa viridis]
MASSGMCLAAAPPVSAVGCAAGPARGVLKLRDQNIAAQRCRAPVRQGTCALPTRHSVIRRRSEKLESLQVAASAAGSLSSTPAAPSEPPFKWGADMKNLGISVGIATVMWFVPPPAGVALQAWHLLAIFLGTIVGIITQPLPLGAVAMLGLGATMLTKVLTFPAAFSAFASEIPWLIAIAFWLSGGFIKSGLGNRVAYVIVAAFGKTTLGLAYSLVFAEALLAPAIPSVAARAGGIFFPLVKALCLACGSDPADGTEKKMGAYLMKTCFQTSTISSAMFITAMAANPLAVDLAKDALGQTISWGQWALAGLVPGLVCLVATPLILYVIYPPEQKDTPDAPEKAREELKKLGPLSRNEKITAGALAVTVGLWIFGGQIGVNAVAAALLGLAVLLITNVVTWKECLSNNAAWDTLTWFAALIGMASYLNKYGFIKWFSGKVVNVVSSYGLSWQSSFGIIVLLYFYSHYLFASGAAHIGAMYTAFLSVAIACGTPGLLAAVALGQLSNVMGCLTTYGIGSAPPYFGAGYVPQSKWYQLGLLMSFFYITVWLGIGGAWWKVIGLW